MTKKEFLLASFSAFAALTLTGCGDSTEDSGNNSTTPTQNDDAGGSTTSDVSESPTEIAARGSEETADMGLLKAAQSLAAQVPEMSKVQPLLNARDQFHNAFEAVDAAKKAGSYNDLMSAYDALVAAYDDIVNKRLVEEASTAFNDYMSRTNKGVSDGVANTHAADLQLVEARIASFKTAMDQYKTNANNATLIGKKSLPQVAEAERKRYNDSLQKMSATVTVGASYATKLARDVGKKVASASKDIVPELEKKNIYWRDMKEDNTAVRQALKDQEANIKAAAVDAVSSAVYSAMKERFTLEYKQNKTLSFGNTRYTLAELRSIAGLTDLSGDIPALNGKAAPKFSGATLAEGAKPTVAQLDKIQAGLDAQVPSYITTFLATDPVSKIFFPAVVGQFEKAAASGTAKLSAGLVKGLTQTSLRDARRGAFGLDAATFALSGASGEKVALAAPLYVKLDGSLEAGKSVNATGTVATKVGNTVVAMTQAHANTGLGFKSESVQSETSVAVSQNFGAAFAEVSLGAVEASNVNGADFSGSTAKLTLGYDAKYVTPFVQLERRNITRSELLDADAAHTSVALGAEVAVANHVADTYSVSTNLKAVAGYETKAWTSLDRHLGTDAEFAGSLDFSGSLKLNSGVSFTSNLGLGSVKGASAGLNFSVAR